MKLSTLWLREWVNYSLTEQELAKQLTMAGLEVDAITPVSGAFTHVVVGHVISTKPHPDADKLTLCEVEANTGKLLSIVCGAANVRAGLKVAVALAGATLPGDFKIKVSKLRGQLSEGMLCSVTELGLDDHSEGIIELAEDAPVGMDLRQYLLLDDQVLDVDLTPNRADCFSALGIAREVAALNNLPLNKPPITAVPPAIDDALKVEIKAKEACSRYCGRIIKQINTTAKTPVWLAERLRRSGIRLLHPVVDIMNYVMIELGQPMHAFDLAHVQGGIEVRYATAKEQLKLLNGQEITLAERVLVIADESKPLALAGVMGGAESAVEAETQDIFLESAFFHPVTIAGVARKYNLFSDSSQRFERGVDPMLQCLALERATALILSIAGGIPGPISEVVAQECLPQPVTLLFDTAKVEKLTGVTIPVEQQERLLKGIGLSVHSVAQGQFQVTMPSHRFDLQLDVDLVEEIIRLQGYDTLQAQPMNCTVHAGKSSPVAALTTKLSHWFQSKGYHETISYSFVDPQLQETLFPQQKFMQLVNPISAELAQMRASIWPGLIAAMIHNMHRQQPTLRFFETGVTFKIEHDEVKEQPSIAGLLTGSLGACNWSETTRAYDFYDLKGDLQALFAFLHLQDVSFVAGAHDALHPGQAAQIMVQGQPVGWIGVLHPRIADVLGVQQDVLLFELALAGLAQGESVRYKTISRYPQIRRDLSFLINKEITASQIIDTVRNASDTNWLKDIDVFDVYMGKGIPEGKKSVAIAITLQDTSRTLVDNEINLLISAIIKSLEHHFSILLRE